MVRRRRRLVLPARAGGYNLVILVMTITVLNIMVAAALPQWSSVLRRHKEAELIFRGLQYAEAIRVFQTRFNRPPVRLQELIETKPRSIRKLWENPMSEDGSWGLILASNQPGEGPDGRPVDQQPPATPSFQPPGASPLAENRPAVPRSAGSGGQPATATGPIQGVYSPEGGTALRTFLDTKEISQWRFTVELVSGSGGAMLPGTQQPVPINSDQIGRPWPPGVVPPALQQGGKGAAPPPGQHPAGPGQPQPRPRRR